MKEIIAYLWPYIATILAGISSGFSLWYFYPSTNMPIAIILCVVAIVLFASAMWVYTDNNIKYEEEERRKYIRENILKK